jgi:predicted aspartyl protease
MLRPARCFKALVLPLVLTVLPDGVPAQVEVPLSAENGWFIVPVTLDDGEALRFIVDTGAALSAVTASTLRRIGVSPGGTVQAQGASGTQELATARIPSLTLGTLRSFNSRMLVLDEGVLTPSGGRVPYDGVLGADIMGAHDVLLDPVSGVLRLFDAGTAMATGPLPPLADPLPLRRIAGPILGHDVEINGSVMPAILDTGSRRVVVSPRAARNARVEAIDGSVQVRRAGVGSQEVRVQDVDLGRVVAGQTELGAIAAQVGALPIFAALGFADRAVVLLGSPALAGCPVLISYSRDTIRYCRALGEL